MDTRFSLGGDQSDERGAETGSTKCLIGWKCFILLFFMVLIRRQTELFFLILKTKHQISLNSTDLKADGDHEVFRNGNMSQDCRDKQIYSFSY